MPRLDPARPVVWRDGRTIGFGTQAEPSVTDPEPWQEDLLLRLRTGLSVPEARRWAQERGVDESLLEGMLQALSPVWEAPPVRRPAVHVEVAEGVDAATAAEVSRMLAHRFPAGPEASAVTVVLAPFEVDPRITARLMREDHPHLPVVLRPDGADVGPLVIPGQGCCMTCLAAYRTDDDPAWPLVAAQLLTGPCPPLDRVVVAEAAVAVVRILCGDLGPDGVVTVSAQACPRVRPAPPPHPDCGCLTPAGNATAAPAAPTMTGRGFARPA